MDEKADSSKINHQKGNRITNSFYRLFDFLPIGLQSKKPDLETRCNRCLHGPRDLQFISNAYQLIISAPHKTLSLEENKWEDISKNSFQQTSFQTPIILEQKQMKMVKDEEETTQVEYAVEEQEEKGAKSIKQVEQVRGKRSIKEQSDSDQQSDTDQISIQIQKFCQQAQKTSKDRNNTVHTKTNQPQLITSDIANCYFGQYLLKKFGEDQRRSYSEICVSNNNSKHFAKNPRIILLSAVKDMIERYKTSKQFMNSQSNSQNLPRNLELFVKTWSQKGQQLQKQTVLGKAVSLKLTPTRVDSLLQTTNTYFGSNYFHTEPKKQLIKFTLEVIEQIRKSAGPGKNLFQAKKEKSIQIIDLQDDS